MVTPISSGGRATPSTASRAARSIASPPLACTFIIHTPRRAADAAGAGHGVGDVVELEVEEHFEAALLQARDHRGPGGDEELLADLHAAQPRVEARGERERGLGVGEVERRR